MVKKSQWKSTLCFGIAALLSFSEAAASRAFLNSYFGVDPDLDYVNSNTNQYGGGTLYHFDYSTLLPSDQYVDYVINDWHGSWSTSDIGLAPTDLTYHNNPQGNGNDPAGGEFYDVEALYMRNDNQYLYVGVVTSVPHPGVNDTRVNAFVVAGDLGFSIGRNGSYDQTGFSYDFGLNLTNEARPASGQNAATRDNTLGADFYETQNTDWYVGTDRNDVSGQGERTSFDPDASSSTAVYIGDAAEVTYEELTFTGNLLETGAATYAIGAKIPLSYFGNLQEGDELGFSFMPGCRNDGQQGVANIRLTTNFVPVPEPGTWLGSGCLIALVGARAWQKRSRKAAPQASDF